MVEEETEPEGEAPAPEEEAPAEAAPKKEKKAKKVVRRRKSKKEKENPLTSAVRLAVESGKVEFGGKAALAGKAKLFVLAGNAPKGIREKLSSLAKASEIPVIEFAGSSMELGAVCGKPFPVSVLSVFDEGSSSIMELARTK